MSKVVELRNPLGKNWKNFLRSGIKMLYDSNEYEERMFFYRPMESGILMPLGNTTGIYAYFRKPMKIVEVRLCVPDSFEKLFDKRGYRPMMNPIEIFDCLSKIKASRNPLIKGGQMHCQLEEAIAKFDPRFSEKVA